MIEKKLASSSSDEGQEAQAGPSYTFDKQPTSLNQYEAASFSVQLSNELADASLIAYATDREDNDYTEVFCWEVVNKGNGLWTTNFAPDR